MFGIGGARKYIYMCVMRDMIQTNKRTNKPQTEIDKQRHKEVASESTKTSRAPEKKRESFKDATRKTETE